MFMIANALIESFIMIFYFNGILHKKQKKYCNIVFLGIVFLNIGKNIIKFPAAYNLIISIFVSFMVAFINYSDKKRKRFFAAGIYIIIMMITEIISDTILSGWLHIDYASVPLLKIEQMASLTNIISFILILYVVIIPSKKIKEISIKYWIMMLLLPLFSAVVLIIFDTMVIDTSSPYTTIYNIFLVTGLLYLNIMIFDFFENFSERIRLKESETIIKNNEKNYKILENSEEELRILKHDLSKHLNIIKDLLNKNQINDINQYLEKLDSVISSINSITYTGHLTLDSILNIEAAKAKALNIRYLVKSNIQAEIHIENIDLTTILCNAIDNAIEAAVAAEKQYVVITISVYNDYINVIIENSYNSILIADDEYKTTKEDAINHGFGLSSINKAIQKYNGTIINERILGINTMKIRLNNMQKLSFTQ